MENRRNSPIRVPKPSNCQVTLSTINDLFDGFIVAHQLERENSVGLVIQTIEVAKRKERIAQGLILQSDQGSQYC